MNIDSLMIPELNEELIASKIYIIRGQKVMLDFELAEIYGYETKNFNRQVKNNNDKFDEDFMFQLSKEEYKEILRCKNFTSSWGGTRHLPYAFTEQGIYMLMTVLKGEYEYYLMIDYSSINDLANVICDLYFKNKEISKENIREKLENMYLLKKYLWGSQMLQNTT